MGLRRRYLAKIHGARQEGIGVVIGKLQLKVELIEPTIIPGLVTGLDDIAYLGFERRFRIEIEHALAALWGEGNDTSSLIVGARNAHQVQMNVDAALLPDLKIEIVEKLVSKYIFPDLRHCPGVDSSDQCQL